MNDKNETPKIIRLVETDSTNNYLREQSAKARLPEGSLVIADFQTAGKGQVGNSWESEAVKNLMCIILLYPDFLPANRQFLISQIASLSVKETLEKYTDSVTVKWPNDIYWKDKKICGMLIENDLMGRNISQSIAGVGININQEVFHSSAPNPVSLFQITGKQYDIFNILEHIMLRIQIYYDLLQKNNTALITAQYERSLFRKEGMYRYKDVNGEFMANIVCVEPEGRLILEDETQTKRGYMFKEVEYLLK